MSKSYIEKLEEIDEHRDGSGSINPEDIDDISNELIRHQCIINDINYLISNDMISGSASDYPETMEFFKSKYPELSDKLEAIDDMSMVDFLEEAERLAQQESLKIAQELLNIEPDGNESLEYLTEVFHKTNETLEMINSEVSIDNNTGMAEQLYQGATDGIDFNLKDLVAKDIKSLEDFDIDNSIDNAVFEAYENINSSFIKEEEFSIENNAL